MKILLIQLSDGRLAQASFKRLSEKRDPDSLRIKLGAAGILPAEITPEEEAAYRQHILAKNLFELSRTTDMTTHFNSTVHTLDAIAAGLPGHKPLSYLSCCECDRADLPQDRYFREAWEDRDGSIQVNMVKAREVHKKKLKEAGVQVPMNWNLDGYTTPDELKAARP